MADSDFFTIIENIITLDSDKKFHKELNLISWRCSAPVYDLRGWTRDRSEMTKGVTLTSEELTQLKEKLGGIEL